MFAGNLVNFRGHNCTSSYFRFLFSHVVVINRLSEISHFIFRPLPRNSYSPKAWRSKPQLRLQLQQQQRLLLPLFHLCKRSGTSCGPRRASTFLFLVWSLHLQLPQPQGLQLQLLLLPSKTSTGGRTTSTPRLACS